MRTEYLVRHPDGSVRRLDTWDQVVELGKDIEQTIIDSYRVAVCIIAVNDLGFEHWTTSDPDANGGPVTESSVVRDFEVTNSELTVETLELGRTMETEKIQADLNAKLTNKLDMVNSFFDYHLDLAQAVQARKDQQV
jgi:hypothetical protein